MWLPANIAVAAALALGPLGWIGRARARRAAEAARETALVLVLYAMWRTLNRVDLRLEGATGRGREIWRLQRAIGLGSERWLQQRIIGHDRVVQAANLFYAGAHVPAMIAFLVWMFLRHRDRYARWRWLLALSTGACVLIRLVPVAPPRLLPELGFVDTAVLHGQSVYGRFGGGVSDQLAAMPSIHASWALIVAAGIWACAPPRRRWIGIAHAVVTMWSIVVTANHWWLDAIVAGALLPPIWFVLGWLDRRRQPGGPGRGAAQRAGYRP
jgi:hypothetical protein